MTRSTGKIFLLALLLLCSGYNAALAQANAPDPRIREVYGTYTDQLSAAQRSWLDNELSRTEIKKLSDTELKAAHLLLSSLPLVTKYKPGLKRDDLSNPAAINPLKYAINFYDPNDQVFRIDGTDYVLLVKGKK